jgi:hypothetical protein
MTCSRLETVGIVAKTYLNGRGIRKEILSHEKQQKVESLVTFVDLIDHDVRVLVEIFLENQFLQQDFSGHVGQDNLIAHVFVEADLIPADCPYSPAPFLADALGDVYGRYASRLGDYYVARRFGGSALVHNVLGDLCGFAATGRAVNYHHGVRVDHVEDLESCLLRN